MADPVAALESGGEVRLIIDQPERDLTGVLRPAYPGQAFDELQSPMLPDVGKLGGVECFLVTLPDAYVLVAPGCDGVVIDAQGRPIRETLHFSDHDNVAREAERLHEAVELDGPVFVGIDTPWFNYFHWLCFGVGKCALVQPYLDDAFEFAFPDYASHPDTPLFPRYRHDVWTGGLEVLSPNRRKRVLKPGVYRAPAVALLATRPSDPTAVTHLDALFPTFSAAGARLKGGPPRRAVILREALPRLEPHAIEQLLDIARAHDFEIVRLEHMSFEAQIGLFVNAQAIVAPHGAGLSNVMFGPTSLKVLELNSDLDKGSGLRPWFYILAAGKRQTYSYLNASAGEITSDRLKTAFEQLMVSDNA